MQSVICGERVSFFQSKGTENKSEKGFDLNISNTYIHIYMFKTETVLSTPWGYGGEVYGRDFTSCAPNDVRNTVASLNSQHIRLFIPVWLQTLKYKNIHSYMTTLTLLCSFTYLKTSFLTRKLHYLTEQGGWLNDFGPHFRWGNEDKRFTKKFRHNQNTLIPEHWKKRGCEISLLEKLLYHLWDNKKKLTKSFFLLLKRYRQVHAHSISSLLVVLCQGVSVLQNSENELSSIW